MVSKTKAVSSEPVLRDVKLRRRDHSLEYLRISITGWFVVSPHQSPWH